MTSAKLVRRTQAFPDPVAGPWAAEIRFGLVDGRVECVGLDVRPLASLTSRPLTAAVVRQLNLSALIDRAREDTDDELLRLALPRQGFGVSLDTLRGIGLGPLGVSRKQPGPKPKNREHYEEAARVYLAAPRNPTQAVREHFHVSESTAAKYVNGARQRGLIAPTTRGRRSGRPTDDS